MTNNSEYPRTKQNGQHSSYLINDLWKNLINRCSNQSLMLKVPHLNFQCVMHLSGILKGPKSQMPVENFLHYNALDYIKVLHKKQTLRLTIAFHVKMYWADGLLCDICPLYQDPTEASLCSEHCFYVL